MLAYVAALHDEVALVLRRGRFEKIRAPGQMLAFLAPNSLKRASELIVATGWGAAAAEAGARWVAKEMRPEAIVAVGYSGGTRGGLKQGTLVMAELVARIGPAAALIDRIAADRSLLGLAHSSAQELRMTVAAGLVGTTPNIVSTSIRKDALGVTTGALAVDLESWHFARAAADSAVPFLAVRAVVDAVDDDLPGFVERLAPGPRPPAALPALRYLIGRPGSLRGIVQTGRAAGRARRTLAQFMWAFSERWQASRPANAPSLPRVRR